MPPFTHAMMALLCNCVATVVWLASGSTAKTHWDIGISKNGENLENLAPMVEKEDGQPSPKD